MVEIFQNVYDDLRKPDLTSNLDIMDNEYSCTIQVFISKKHINVQFVIPQTCRVNAAIPAVKAVKYHTIASLTTVNPTCLLQFLRNKWFPISKTR